MKKLFVISISLGLAISMSSLAWGEDVCNTIKEGEVTYQPGRYLENQTVPTGYDMFGYNYQAHMFNGLYCNAYLNGDGFPPYEGDDTAYAQRLLDEGFTTDPYGKWYWPYRNDQLMMKWNDAWLSNKDCDADGLLDRYYGFPSYIGSGAWLTNHQSGGQGKDHWVFFCKIVAVPDDATKIGGIWYAADGTEIGPEIWGAFAIIQEVESGLGATYVSPAGPGFGQY